MTTSTRRDLRQNPFTAYRDPKTGQWIVINHHSQPVSKNNTHKSQISIVWNARLD